MSPRASAGTPTNFSVAVARTIDRQIGLSGIPVAQVLREAGLSRNYYYKRVRGEGMFNTNDIDKIGHALGLDPFALTALALQELEQARPVAPVVVGSFGQNRDDSGTEIPDDVEDEWEGRYAAHPNEDWPEDHTP